MPEYFITLSPDKEEKFLVSLDKCLEGIHNNTISKFSSDFLFFMTGFQK